MSTRDQDKSPPPKHHDSDQSSPAETTPGASEARISERQASDQKISGRQAPDQSASARETSSADTKQRARAHAEQAGESTHRSREQHRDRNSARKRSGDTSSLFRALRNYTGVLTSNLVDVVKSGSAIPLMYTDNWLKDVFMKTADPERLQAMVDAGRFLKDAREVAGLNLQELSEALGLGDEELLREVEEGRATLPFDMILRIAALIARHDPIPFIIKFVRTYNPALEQKLEAWGVAKLPKQYERERRFTNILRKHDVLRGLSDAEFERLVKYQESAIDYALTIMLKEKEANNKS